MRSGGMILPLLVDCDIHVGYESISDLLPYLDAPTRELVVNSGTFGLAMPSYPWNHPTGWFRHDVYERDTGQGADFAYLTLDTLRERHLDVYDVTLGVVEPDEAASFSIIPNAQLAARLCTAYNDWLLERWLQEEPRLRGMLVVPAQYPEAAAKEIRRLGGRDEFVGVFLPGGARIPYGNPTYDPL
jgi:predicted TIM-barrel fold metal-dependent hydrolase